VVRRPLTVVLYQPRMLDDECEAVGGMRLGRGNRGTRRKPASVPLRPPQLPHDDLESNPDRRGGKLATNRLSYGATTYPFCGLFYVAVSVCTTSVYRRVGRSLTNWKGFRRKRSWPIRIISLFGWKNCRNPGRSLR
jgi:hypothetical protein